MIEVLQVRSEFEPVLGLYRERKPRSVLEIGTWEGGTLREWLTLGRPKQVVAVDLEHRNPELYEEWCKAATRLHVITGDSQEAAIKAAIRRLGPYEWLFIDGDHSEGGVRSDVELALECAVPGALLLLHDISRGIHNEGDPGPAIVLDELAERYRVERNVEDNRIGGHRWAHGIGIVHLP